MHWLPLELELQVVVGHWTLVPWNSTLHSYPLTDWANSPAQGFLFKGNHSRFIEISFGFVLYQPLLFHLASDFHDCRNDCRWYPRIFLEPNLRITDFILGVIWQGIWLCHIQDSPSRHKNIPPQRSHCPRKPGAEQEKHVELHLLPLLLWKAPHSSLHSAVFPLGLPWEQTFCSLVTWWRKWCEDPVYPFLTLHRLPANSVCSSSLYCCLQGSLPAGVPRNLHLSLCSAASI